MRRFIILYRKKQLNGVLFFTLITLSLFIGVSSLGIVENSESTSAGALQSPNISSNLELPWEDSGDAQEVRAYIRNHSSALGQTDEFDITVPTTPSAIYSADMNFKILSGVETAHEFEQDTPLEYPRSYRNSRYNPYWTTNQGTSTDALTINRGIETGGSDGFTGLVDTNSGTSLDIRNDSSSTDYEVRITYTANFTGVTGFDKLKTVGFRIYADRYITENVITDIYLYNTSSTTWDLVYNENWDLTREVQVILLQNTRLAYINSNNQVQIRINLRDNNPFSVFYYDLKVEALIAVQVDLSSSVYVAMEFDTRGDANASGLFAWVRTLTPTLPGANLIVQLYRANQTATRSNVVSAIKTVMKPGTLLASNTITNFAQDNYVFIPFKSDYSKIALNVSNYFAVLSASSSGVYSVVTIPYSDGDSDPNNQDPDTTIDHLFLSNSTGTWSKVKVGGGQVDASPFAINLTRSWLPEEIDMQIDGVDVRSYSNTSGIYAPTSGYYWGLGKWNNLFVTEIRDISNQITIQIDFNATTAPSLNFDVIYTAVVYSIEDTTTQYYVNLNEDPSWELNYTLSMTSYTGWEYKNFSFVIPSDWSLVELLDTNRNSLLEDYEVLVENGITQYWILEHVDGNYTLNATSPNYVFAMNTYLQFEDHYWETHGFMQGDNISLALGILNYTKTTSPIYSGVSSVEVYDPDNNPLPTLTMNDLTPDDSEAVLVNNQNLLLTYYEFNSKNLLNTTGSTRKGEYSLVFKYDNGNELGYKVLSIFIMEYGVNITNISEDLEKQMDIVRSSIVRNLTTASTYNVTVFAIEDITGLPLDGSYHIEEKIGLEYTQYNLNVNLTQIMVNESLFNPGEVVKLNITFESYNEFWDTTVDVHAQFVQSINYEWIVMEQSTSFTLGMLGTGTENATVQLIFSVPSDFKGINAPIRLNPFILKLDITLNDANMDSLYLDTLFPFIEKTESEFEGKVWTDSRIHYRAGPIGPIFSAEINRVDQLVHTSAIYLMQISDSYFVTCAISEYEDFSSKPIAVFESVNTIDLIWGGEFQLQGNLLDEFGTVIDNQTINVSLFTGSEWVVYNQTSENPLVSDLDGFFNGTYNTNIVSKSNSLKLSLSWIGNATIFGATSVFQLDMITYENIVRIEIINSTQTIFLKEKQENTLLFKITNMGNSTLLDFNIEFLFPGTSLRIGDLNYSTNKQLSPLEFFYLELYVTIPGSFQGGLGTISVTVDCENHDSHEIVATQASFELSVLTASFLDNLDGFFKIIFFIGLSAIILGAGYYSLRIYRKLQQTPQKEVAEPKRGRYVEVAKLQKQSLEKDIEPEEKEEEEEKTADLDDLLKKEGLKD